MPVGALLRSNGATLHQIMDPFKPLWHHLKQVMVPLASDGATVAVDRDSLANIDNPLDQSFRLCD